MNFIFNSYFILFEEIQVDIQAILGDFWHSSQTQYLIMIG